MPELDLRDIDALRLHLFAECGDILLHPACDDVPSRLRWGGKGVCHGRAEEEEGGLLRGEEWEEGLDHGEGGEEMRV